MLEAGVRVKYKYHVEDEVKAALVADYDGRVEAHYLHKLRGQWRATAIPSEVQIVVLDIVIGE